MRCPDNLRRENPLSPDPAETAEPTETNQAEPAQQPPGRWRRFRSHFSFDGWRVAPLAVVTVVLALGIIFVASHFIMPGMVLAALIVVAVGALIALPEVKPDHWNDDRINALKFIAALLVIVAAINGYIRYDNEAPARAAAAEAAKTPQERAADAARRQLDWTYDLYNDERKNDDSEPDVTIDRDLTHGWVHIVVQIPDGSRKDKVLRLELRDGRWVALCRVEPDGWVALEDNDYAIGRLLLNTGDCPQGYKPPPGTPISKFK